MALASNSSIREWLEFNGTVPLTLQPCHQYIYPDNYKINESFIPVPTIANCTQVCNDSTSLFTSPSNNLVVCGLWTQVIAYATYIGPGNSILLPNNYSNPFEVYALEDGTFEAIDPTPFQAIGLNVNNTDTPSYADIVSGCFMDIYSTVNVNASSGADTVPTACTKNSLFPLLTNESWTGLQFSSMLEDQGKSVPYTVRDCIDAICSPRTVNADVAGIGVCESTTSTSHCSQTPRRSSHRTSCNLALPS